jgi:hypothetical protein
MHGASAPQALAAAERRMQALAAEDAVVTFGLPRDVDPGDALLEAVHAAAGHVAWLRGLVGELEAGELKQRDLSGKFERPAVWVELYGEWTDRLARVAKAALDAGVAERLVRNAERLAFAQAQGVELFVQGVLGRLGLSWDSPEVQGAVVAELEAGEVQTL